MEGRVALAVLVDRMAVGGQQTHGLDVAVEGGGVHRMRRGGAQPQQVLGEPRIAPVGDREPERRRAPFALGERGLLDPLAAGDQHIGGAHGRRGQLGIAGDVASASQVQPAPAALVAPAEQLRALVQAGGHGLGVKRLDQFGQAGARDHDLSASRAVPSDRSR